MVLSSLRAAVGRMPRPAKRLVLMGFDALVLTGSVWLSYALRFSTWFVPTAEQWLLIAAAPAIAIPVFVKLGLYRAVIRYLPDRAIWTMLQAVTLAAVLWVMVVFLVSMAGSDVVPRSVPVFYWLIAAMAVIGSRFATKYVLWAPREQQLAAGQILIYGAGETGAHLALALRQQGRRVVAGFLDDDPALRGRDISGIRVYAPESLGTLITNFGIKEVILSLPRIDSTRRQEIVGKLTRFPIRIRTLPPIGDLLSGKVLVNQLREVDIDELLGRSSVSADTGLLAQMIENRAILVTGAGGSIGSELCRLIMRWQPRTLVLLEQNEFALYSVHRQLAALGGVEVVPVLASVGDRPAVDAALRAHGIETVFHAAAHKHVPLVEANALEGMRNNVLGTWSVTAAAFDAGVEHFVLISSDKAVRPTNVMGATKRWSEFIMRFFAQKATDSGTGQRFCAVRFGNVLGSNGSVVPLFTEQIAAGGPVTVTDERMTRYFMSIHEAAELIVQAGALSGGDDIFLLEMGAPVPIIELARNMIQLAGHSVRDEANPGGSIEIEVTGSRPGEKLFEELFYDPANASTTAHPKILRTVTSTARRDIEGAMAMLRERLEARDEAGARECLFGLIEQ